MLPICYGEVVFTWQLNGTVPKALGRLENLRVIDISSNGLIGPIPESIGRLRFLEVLDLPYNLESFGNLATLVDLNLEFNCLAGPLPVSITCQTSFSRYLLQLFIRRSVLSPFSNLSELVELDTSKTKLAFNISHEWVPPFQLSNLDLSSCNIINGFPQWLQNPKNLRSWYCPMLKFHDPSPHGCKR